MLIEVMFAYQSIFTLHVCTSWFRTFIHQASGLKIHDNFPKWYGYCLNLAWEYNLHESGISAHPREYLPSCGRVFGSCLQFNLSVCDRFAHEFVLFIDRNYLVMPAMVVIFDIEFLVLFKRSHFSGIKTLFNSIPTSLRVVWGRKKQ